MIGEKLKILLVEDAEIPQMMAKNILERYGYLVDVADDGGLAIELTKAKVYDMIFMDLGLPDKNGFEVTKEIRGDVENPNNNTIIIALTAHDTEEKRQVSKKSGMNDFVAKPLTHDTLKSLFGNNYT